MSKDTFDWITDDELLVDLILLFGLEDSQIEELLPALGLEDSRSVIDELPEITAPKRDMLV